MSEKILLPLRIGVGVIVLNEKNRVFVGKRKDNPEKHWQMQGDASLPKRPPATVSRAVLPVRDSCCWFSSQNKALLPCLLACQGLVEG